MGGKSDEPNNEKTDGSEKLTMWWKNLLVCISLIVFLFSGGSGLAACPSADLSSDCFVDYEDFALLAQWWLWQGPWYSP